MTLKLVYEKRLKKKNRGDRIVWILIYIDNSTLTCGKKTKKVQSTVLLIFKSVTDHPFKTSACLRGGGVSPCADVKSSQYIRIKNPLHKHFAGMPMVGG